MSFDEGERRTALAFLAEVGGQPWLRWQSARFREALAQSATPLSTRAARRLFRDLHSGNLDKLIVLGRHATVLAVSDLEDDSGRWRTATTLREGALFGCKASGISPDGGVARAADEESPAVTHYRLKTFGSIWLVDPAKAERASRQGLRGNLRDRFGRGRMLHASAWRAANWVQLVAVASRVEAVQHAPDLRALHPRQVLTLAQAAKPRWAEAGEVLQELDSRPRCLSLLGGGTSVELQDPSGRRVMLGAGSMVGWTAWRRAETKLQADSPTGEVRFRRARVTRAGWILEWDRAALRLLAGRTGLLRGQWLARMLEERAEVHHSAEDVLELLRYEPVLRDAPHGALHTLLQSATLVEWRAGAPPPVPIGLEAGLTVVLQGELVGYRLLPRIVAHSVHAVRLHPVRVARGRTTPGASDLGIMGSALPEDTPGDDQAGAMGDVARTRWQARGPTRSLFIPAKACSEALDDLPSYRRALDAERESLRALRADRQTTDGLDTHQGRFHDALNLQWVARAHATGMGDVQAEDVGLLERVADSIWTSFADRTLLLELGSDDEEVVEVACGNGWVRLRSPAQSYDVLDQLKLALQAHPGASHVLVWQTPGSDLGERLAHAADGVMLLSYDASAPVPRGLHNVQGMIFASMVRVKRGVTLPPTALRLHALTEGEHAPERGYAGRREALARWARAITYRRVGVALGGGGAWGWAHVALLRAMAGESVPVDLLSGVSFGSVAGGFYGLAGNPGMQFLLEHDRELQGVFQRGYVSGRWITSYFDGRLDAMEAWAAARFEASVAQLVAAVPDGRQVSQALALPTQHSELSRVAEALDGLPDSTWHDDADEVRQDLPSRESLHDDLAVLHGLYSLRDPADPARMDIPLEHLPVPFLPVATELVSGSSTPMLGCTVGEGVRASGALPPVFSVVRGEEGTYVDGAMTYNVPSGPLHLEGAALLVASNIVPPSVMHVPAPVRVGAASMLSDLNPLRRAMLSVVGLQTLFNTSGLVTTGLDPVLFESEWNGTLFFQIDRGEQVVQDTYGSASFLASSRGLAEALESTASATGSARRSHGGPMSYEPPATTLQQTLSALVGELGASLPADASDARLTHSRLKRAVRRVGRLEAEVERLRTMLRDTHDVIGEGRLEVAAQKVLDSLIAILGARRGMVGLEMEDGDWHILAGRDLEGKDLSNPDSQVSRGVVETVLATGKHVKEDDAVTGSFRGRKSVVSMGLRSVLCFPFDVGDDLGFVYVDNHMVLGAFDDDALQAVEVWIPLLASCLSRAAG